MLTKVTTTRSVWRRRIALAVGAVLLLAQSLGAAHYHPAAFGPNRSITTAAAANDTLCSLCLHHYHAPSLIAAQIPIAAPRDAGYRDSKDFRFALVSTFDSHLFGRAPPASV